jgi:hypothetical protein
MRTPRAAVVGWLLGRLTRLRFPTLFAVSAVLFLVTLVVPDAIPFADELLLGLATALLAAWRKRGAPEQPVPPGGPGAQVPSNSGR